MVNPSQHSLPLATSPQRSWYERLFDDIDPRYSDMPVLMCCTMTGLCDAVVFNAAGVFVGMQTGNTIFLALGAAHLPPLESQLWVKAIVSIGAFWAGCFTFSQFRHVGPKRKLTLAANFLLQAVFMLAVAIITQTGAIPQFRRSAISPHVALHNGEHDSSWIVLLPVALLAFQFGGQVVSSRVLGFNEVPTSVLTSLYCDLMSDPKLFAPLGKNEKRNRRVCAMVMLLIGGILGGWLQRSSGGMPPAIWAAGGLKIIIAVAWLFWKSKEKQ
ncbi:putative membrane protein [Ceratocystis platani]|uniref:Putative membrane protein n=1 Tax=Ceratocystis fimbriata f. sp. platani TaxID=88771 RepID=A0A0F8D328_CERFI|nr:putative membrane protein [Ceratocystis platani]